MIGGGGFYRKIGRENWGKWGVVLAEAGIGRKRRGKHEGGMGRGGEGGKRIWEWLSDRLFNTHFMSVITYC